MLCPGNRHRQHRQAVVAVLNVSRQDVHPDPQPEGVDDRMALALLDLLAGVNSLPDPGFPLPALLTLWLLTTAAIGLASCTFRGRWFFWAY